MPGFIKIRPNAALPLRGSDGAAGYDLVAAIDMLVSVHNTCIPTGVGIVIPHNFYGQVASRSGLAVKQNFITVAGVIDSDYRGEIGVVVRADPPYQVKAGDRIAQLLILPCVMEDSVWTDATPTERGVAGYGSTGSSVDDVLTTKEG